MIRTRFCDDEYNWLFQKCPELQKRFDFSNILNMLDLLRFTKVQENVLFSLEEYKMNIHWIFDKPIVNSYTNVPFGPCYICGGKNCQIYSYPPPLFRHCLDLMDDLQRLLHRRRDLRLEDGALHLSKPADINLNM